MAYDLAEQNNLPYNFNKTELEKAGKKCYYNFMKRHPRLSLRAPEPTSLARVQGFNQESVSRFFDLLENTFEESSFDATQIYSVNESGLTSIQKPGRVLSMKGKKQVGGLTNTERGKTTSVVCCVSASGGYVKRKCKSDILKAMLHATVVLTTLRATAVLAMLRATVVLATSRATVVLAALCATVVLTTLRTTARIH